MTEFWVVKLEKPSSPQGPAAAVTFTVQADGASRAIREAESEFRYPELWKVVEVKRG